MDDEIDSLVIGVRADTSAFARDVAAMRSTLTDGLGGGATRAGATIEAALARAVKSGKTGFDDLRGAAVKALGEIASAALGGGIGAAAGGTSGLTGIASSLLGAALGLPGRATGGAVSPGAAYLVGERGPELFVPTSSGSVVPGAVAGARDVKVAIAINAPASAEPRALAQSSRQVARAVSRALQSAER